MSGAIVSSKEEAWDYYQDLLKSNGFKGITDLLTRYKQLESAKEVAEATVAVPENINDLAENFIDGMSTASLHDWEYIDVKNAFIGGYEKAMLSTPTPPSAEQTQVRLPADVEELLSGDISDIYLKPDSEQPDSVAVEPVENWIKCSERLPTKKDADLAGNVICKWNSWNSGEIVAIKWSDVEVGDDNWLETSQTKPQRITEQDAREIVFDVLSIEGYADESSEDVWNTWLHKKGSTLLAKLNEHREPDYKTDLSLTGEYHHDVNLAFVYKAQRDKIVAAIDNISPIELKASDNVTIAYGIGFQTWHDLVAIAKASASNAEGGQ